MGRLRITGFRGDQILIGFFGIRGLGKRVFRVIGMRVRRLGVPGLLRDILLGDILGVAGFRVRIVQMTVLHVGIGIAGLRQRFLRDHGNGIGVDRVGIFVVGVGAEDVAGSGPTVVDILRLIVGFAGVTELVVISRGFGVVGLPARFCRVVVAGRVHVMVECVGCGVPARATPTPP